MTTTAQKGGVSHGADVVSSQQPTGLLILFLLVQGEMNHAVFDFYFGSVVAGPTG